MKLTGLCYREELLTVEIERFPMELQEFRTEALIQIQRGVQGAIEQFEKEPNKFGQISPALEVDGKIDWMTYRQNVEFDIAVTVSDKKTDDGKLGASISIASIGFNAGGQRSHATENSTVSWVKFTIPILPALRSITM